MTILENLSFSNKTRASMLTSPETRLRAKMLDAIDLQIEAVKAMLSGETYVRRVMRWVTDPESLGTQLVLDARHWRSSA